MKHPFFKIFFLYFNVFYAYGQMDFNIQESLKVINNSTELPMALAGGINSAQINMMDFNNDGIEDLIIYERTTGDIKPFQASGTTWIYRPDIKLKFPEVSNWLLLRDFNGDGKKDLFTSHPLGIQVFVNISTGADLLWRPFNQSNALETSGISGSINIYLSQDDLPAIDDIDGDGMLDIINFGYLSSTLEYNKNISTTQDTLIFSKVSDRWGDVEECGCGVFSFDVACAVLIGGKVEHTNGRALLTLDADGDGDKDLLIGEETCYYLEYLENTGNSTNAILRNPSDFPLSGIAAGLFLYPTPFYEDIDHDGKKDLLVTTNTKSNSSYYMNFKNNILFYKNQGSTSSPQFQYVQKNYLHNQMIDVGENNSPIFEDMDNDGDYDMIVGRQTDVDFSGRSSSLYLYENVGTSLEPIFQLVNNDFLNLSSRLFFNIKPQLADIDNNKNMDLIFTANYENQGYAIVYYILNPSFFNFNITMDNLNSLEFYLDIDDTFYFYDIDNDEDLDLLFGHTEGNLELYENKGFRNLQDFEFSENNFFNFGIGSVLGAPSVEISDIDNTGEKDLLVSGNNGSIFLFREFERFLNNPPVPENFLLYYRDESYISENILGSINRLSVVNLYNEDLPGIAVGTEEGGLHFLRNRNAIQFKEIEHYSVNPIPQQKGEFIKFDSNRKIIVQIFSIKGQKMSPAIKIRSEEDFHFMTQDLAAGVYIARIYYDEYSYEVKKFVVTN
ncbi:MAG: VCBS repeat-containing protein [Cyclobacteriaceae bacterium]|nr:VCBS repeat-containing protein [Cyclobacteriaceae bacterium]